MGKLQVESLVWALIVAALVTGQGCGSAADFESEPNPGLDEVATAGPDPDTASESAEGVADEPELSADIGGEEGVGGFGGTGGDPGPQIFPCTEPGIRDAIAEGGGPHFFDCDGPQTVITEATIEVDNDVILDGEDRLTIDANGQHRVLVVAADIEAALVGITVRRGTIGRDDALSFGGGIYNEGDLTLANSSVSNNAAAYDGGGIYNSGSLTLKNTTVSDNAVGLVDRGLDNALGGGIANAGDLTIVDSVIAGNTATMYGAGLYDRGTTTVINSAISENEASGYGGGVYSRGDLTIERTTISDNSGADEGTGIYSSGAATLVDSSVLRNGDYASDSAIKSTGTLTLIASSVSSNAGDGIYASGTTSLTNSSVWGNGGVGVGTFRATLTVTGSTVWGNARGGISASGTTTLIHSTVSGNTGDGIRYLQGTLALSNSTLRGGLMVGVWNGASLVEMTGTLIDGSCSVAATAESASYTSYGYNVESPGNTCGFDQATDQVNVIRDRLRLGPLADNGGPTLTHAPRSGSVAIDAIPAEDCIDMEGAALTTDQRGEPRDSACDIGAVEAQP